MKVDYSDIEKEVVDHLGGMGIELNLKHSKLSESESVVETGRSLRNYTDKIVERALLTLGRHQKQAELGQAVERVLESLADKNIEIKVTDK